MLSSLKIYFENEDYKDINYNSGSLMQGVLMENISWEYGEVLHSNNINPYSQYIKKENGKLVWTINTLNKEARSEIIMKLFNYDKEEFYIKHKDISLKIDEMTVEDTKYQDLFERYYLAERVNPYINMSINTPCSFKMAGRYINYPNIKSIFGNLINKFDTNSEKTKIGDDDNVFEEFVERSEIVSYNLRSCNYYMEGNKIPAFSGKITIRIRGHKNLIALGNMLFDFAEFSGLGIKTSMGMGAVKREVRENGRKED